jgi:hypothetical protein
MAIFTADTRDAWQALANQVAPQRPIRGTHVRITRGTYMGTEGTVTWHGVDTYASTRYFDSAMLALRQMHGREGYRIRVQPAQGEAFFCKAEYAEVLAA